MKKVSYLMSVLMVALIAFTSCTKSTPESVTESFLKSYQNGDYAALVEQAHFTQPLTDEQKAEFTQMIEAKGSAEVEKKQGIASYEVGEVVMAEDGQSAKVNYTITFGDGTTRTDKQSVVLVDGKWMIDGGK